jgi:hypothetical protein
MQKNLQIVGRGITTNMKRQSGMVNEDITY